MIMFFRLHLNFLKYMYSTYLNTTIHLSGQPIYTSLSTKRGLLKTKFLICGFDTLSQNHFPMRKFRDTSY